MSLTPANLITYSAITGATCFYKACKLFKQRSMLKDTAISDISAAAQGFVELKGQAKSIGRVNSIISPISKTPCCAYIIKAVDTRGRNNEHLTIRSHDPFQITDQHGNTCNIDPAQSEYFTDKMQRTRACGNKLSSDLTSVHFKNKSNSRFTSVLCKTFSGITYDEYILVDGADIFVSGFFCTKTVANGKQSNWIEATMPQSLNENPTAAMQTNLASILTNPEEKQAFDEYKAKTQQLFASKLPMAKKQQIMQQLSTDIRKKIPALNDTNTFDNYKHDALSKFKQMVYSNTKSAYSNKTKNEFIISSVPFSSVTKRLCLKTILCFAVALITLPICAWLIVFFQGDYFKILFNS